VASLDQRRPSSGATGGMNNQIQPIGYRPFGFRSAQDFMAAICHRSAPLPVER
jgi:hypothetical protein